MRVSRLYLAGNYQLGGLLDLSKDQVHYLLNVLRLPNSALLEVFDGISQQASAELIILSKSKAQVKLVEISQPQVESPLKTLLLQGISRGERMDYSLQKAVELGVHTIQPVFTARNEVKLKGDRLIKRQEQWQAQVINACEQSGRVAVPEVLLPIQLADWFEQNSSKQGIVLDPYSELKFSEIFQPNLAESFAVLIGAEGGLTDEEVNQAEKVGLQRVQLGKRILRTETVAPVILSLLQQQFGDF